MVLEPCLAELLHSGHINFGVACISRLLDAHLIDASKHTKLCQAVRLPFFADACCCAAWIKLKHQLSLGTRLVIESEQTLMRTGSKAPNAQVADYFTCLSMASILPTGSLSTLHANQALQNHGLAELLQSAFKRTEGAANGTSNFCFSFGPRFSDIKIDTILSLAWPHYLQELAASKSPITQVCTSVLELEFEVKVITWL